MSRPVNFIGVLVYYVSMKKILLRVADSLGLTSKIPRTRIDAFLQKYATKVKTLDLGGGDGPYRRYFPNSTRVDIEQTTGVDVVADAHNLAMFDEGEFECVLLTEVLEHLHTPEKAIQEMYRVLRPGGKIILTTRFVFPLHNIPGDYFRFTRYGLLHLLRNFKEVHVEEEIGTIGTLAVLFERLAFQSETLWFKPFNFFWLVLSKATLLFQSIITREYGEVGHRSGETKNIMASGYYAVAVK